MNYATGGRNADVSPAASDDSERPLRAVLREASWRARTRDRAFVAAAAEDGRGPIRVVP